MPELDFAVAGAQVLTYAAAPTILFKLHIRNAVADERIQSILLRTQIRIEAARRHYDPPEETRLQEIFGESHRWRDTLRSLLWAHAVTNVPGFEGDIVAELPIACTYDFEVAAAKYFYALEDGDVPLLFLFSGTIFYARDEEGLQISQLPWEKEASFRLPVRLWKETMDHYFPNSAWMRVRKDVFDRLYRYRMDNALPTWEDALERLLQGRESG